nr:transposase [Gynuella sunshinyii]
METITAQIRAKVEHSFFYIKRMFDYSKVGYRGLAKNTNRLYLLCAFANLMKVKSLLT